MDGISLIRRANTNPIHDDEQQRTWTSVIGLQFLQLRSFRRHRRIFLPVTLIEGNHNQETVSRRPVLRSLLVIAVVGLTIDEGRPSAQSRAFRADFGSHGQTFPGGRRNRFFDPHRGSGLGGYFTGGGKFCRIR